MNKTKPKIFLSYAHEDIGMAKKIYDDLSRYGVDIWFDIVSLLPGQRWKIPILPIKDNIPGKYPTLLPQISVKSG